MSVLVSTEKDTRKYCLHTKDDRIAHEKIRVLGANDNQEDSNYYFDLCNYIAYGQISITLTLLALPTSFFLLWLVSAQPPWFGICGFLWFNLLFFFIFLTRNAQYALKTLYKEDSVRWHAVSERLCKILREKLT